MARWTGGGRVDGRSKTSTTHSFVRGATLLAAAGLVTRLMGGLARIPVTRFLGGEGMGLFQMAYVIYTMAITFAVSGLTVSTSRLIAEWSARGHPGEAVRVLRVSVVVALVSGAVVWALLDRGAPWLATTILGDPRACAALRLIAPAVLLVSVICAFRGYFQGFQTMGPPAAAHVLEQLIRVAVMVWLVIALRGEGVERAVSGATSANSAGALAGLLLLVRLYAVRQGAARRRPRACPGPGGERRPRTRGGERRPRTRGGAPRLYLPPSTGEIVRRLLAAAIPVTLGAAVLPLMDAVQTFIVPGRLLAAGFTSGEATELYGRLHGMAYPLAGLPAIVASAVAAALVPAITEVVALGRGDQVRSRAEAALRLTVIFSLPSTAGLMVLARPINEMLFGLPEAGEALLHVAPACLLIALQQTTSGVLQGLGRVTVPFYGLVAGLFVNTAVTYHFTGPEGFGIGGAAWGIVAGFLTAATVNLWVVMRSAGSLGDAAGLILKPTAATGVMVAATVGAYRWGMTALGGNTEATLLGVAAGVIAYGAALLVMAGVSEREAGYLPVIGPHLGSLLKRRRKR